MRRLLVVVCLEFRNLLASVLEGQPGIQFLHVVIGNDDAGANRRIRVVSLLLALRFSGPLRRGHHVFYLHDVTF